MNNRLDRPVDAARDHIVGTDRAEITLVEYGSYDCPHCRAANSRIAEVRGQLGDRVRYVFRHRPLSGSEIARRAADLVEQAGTPDEFWSAHVALMTRSRTLTEDDLRAVAEDLRIAERTADEALAGELAARTRVDADVASSHASGVRYTPTFFINGLRYDGPWDEASFTDAMLGSLGHRTRVAALQFASWAPATGVILLLASLLALFATNSNLGPAFENFWQTPFGFSLGDGGFRVPDLGFSRCFHTRVHQLFHRKLGVQVRQPERPAPSAQHLQILRRHDRDKPVSVRAHRHVPQVRHHEQEPGHLLQQMRRPSRPAAEI